MMRVLIVLSSAKRRGAEIQGTDLGSALRDAGVDASVVALTPAADGSPSIDVPSMGGSALAPRTLARLRAHASSSDVVIGYGSKTLPACSIALAGTAARFVYRSIGDPRAWAGGGLHRWRTSQLYRRPDRVVTLWDGAADAVHDLYGVPLSKTVSVPNARFASDFPPFDQSERAEARCRYALPKDAPVAGWIGTMGPEKRVALAIEAVASRPDLHLLVAGDGVDRDAADAAASQVGSRIQLIGPIAETRPFFAAIDVLVSTSRTEGMPGVIIEAALSGRPAVATDVGATRAVVGSGGRVVPADSGPAEIGAGLSDVVASGFDYATAARSHALESFTWDSVLPRWLDVLENLVGPPDGDA